MRKAPGRWPVLLSRGSSHVAGALLAVLDRRIATRPGEMAVGAWNGLRYCDNPRYFALEAAAAGDRITWLTRSRQARAAARREGLRSYFWWQLRGIATACRAPVWVYSHTGADVSPMPPGRRQLVCLTHGTPLKRIDSRAGQGRVPQWLRPLARRAAPAAPTVMCVATPTARRRFQQVTGLSSDAVVVTGYPRWSPIMAAPRAGRRLLYAPTQRGHGLRAFDAADIAGMEEFRQACRSLGIAAYARSHFAQQNSILRDSWWMPMGVDVTSDINDVLGDFDILVTDYSSIWYDFILYRDKVALLAPDLADYTSTDQGLLVDDVYREAPGPVLADWAQVAGWLVDGMPMKADRVRELRDEAAGVSRSSAVPRIRALIGGGLGQYGPWYDTTGTPHP